MSDVVESQIKETVTFGDLDKKIDRFVGGTKNPDSDSGFDTAAEINQIANITGFQFEQKTDLNNDGTPKIVNVLKNTKTGTEQKIIGHMKPIHLVEQMLYGFFLEMDEFPQGVVDLNNGYYENMKMHPKADADEALGLYLRSKGIDSNESIYVKLRQNKEAKEKLTKTILHKHYGDDAERLRPLSFSGGTAVVYTDGENLAYKVHLPENDIEAALGEEEPEFDQESAEYANKEIDIVHQLGPLGICPEDKKNLSRKSYTENGVEVHSAVVVMDYVDPGKIPPEDALLYEEKLQELIDAVVKAGVDPTGSAAELVWDKKSKKFIFLDPGELKTTGSPDNIETWMRQAAEAWK